MNPAILEGSSSGTGESVCFFVVIKIYGWRQGFLSHWEHSFICLVLRFLFCFLLISLVLFFLTTLTEHEGSWFLVLPGIEAVPLQWKCGILTTGLQEVPRLLIMKSWGHGNIWLSECDLWCLSEWLAKIRITSWIWKGILGHTPSETVPSRTTGPRACSRSYYQKTWVMWLNDVDLSELFAGLMCLCDLLSSRLCTSLPQTIARCKLHIISGAAECQASRNTGL